MSRFRKMITAVCTLALVAGVFSGALLIHFRASATGANEAFMMDSLVSDTVQSKGEPIEKEIADVQLLHGAWGSYTKFDTFYDAVASGQGSNAEDMVSDSQSLASAGDHQEVKTYIKRYQLSAIQGNDLVMKFTFKQNAELKETHGAGMDRNWTNQGYFYWVVEPGDGSAVTLKEQLAPGEMIAENALAYTVHAKAGDTVYLIYRMKGETNVPGHDYVNVMLDFRFDLAVGNYNAESRQSALDGGTPLTPSTPVEETKFNFSSITSATAQNKGEPIEKEAADVQLLHGKWGEYTKFDTFYDAIAAGEASNNNDKVSDSASTAAGLNGAPGTYFTRGIIGATKDNDAVMKFTFKKNAKVCIDNNDGFWGNQYTTHASLYVIQVAEDGKLTNIMIKQGTSTIVKGDYSCVVHAKAGDVVYFIYRMTNDAAIAGNDYANFAAEFEVLMSEEEYDEALRQYAFEHSVEDPYAGGAGEDKTEETEFNLSSITSATAQNKGEPIEKEIADVQLLHGKWGEYTKFDTFYDAIAAGEAANNNDKVSDSASTAAGLNGAPGTYFTRGIIGATKDNDAVAKFTFKKNAKVNIDSGNGFWDNQYTTHARLYIIQVAQDGTLTNIMIKQGKSTIAQGDYSCVVHAKAGDVVYFIYRMTNDAAIAGNDYANFAVEFDFLLSEENYDEELRQYAFEHSVEDIPDDPGTTPGGSSDVPLPPPDDPNLDIDTPNADNPEGGCGSVVTSGLAILLVLSAAGLLLVRRKRGGKRGEN